MLNEQDRMWEGFQSTVQSIAQSVGKDSARPVITVSSHGSRFPPPPTSSPLSRTPSNESISGSESPSSDFEAGSLVEIVRGTHKGESGIFIKRTDKRFCIRLIGAAKPVYLSPESIGRRDATPLSPSCVEHRSVWPPLIQPGGPTEGNVVDRSCREIVRSSSLSENQAVDPTATGQGPQVPSFRSHTTLSDFSPGDSVDIVGGTYKGKVALFVKRTEKKVCVQLIGATRRVYLSPESIGGRELMPACVEQRSLQPALIPSIRSVAGTCPDSMEDCEAQPCNHKNIAVSSLSDNMKNDPSTNKSCSQTPSLRAVTRSQTCTTRETKVNLCPIGWELVPKTEASRCFAYQVFGDRLWNATFCLNNEPNVIPPVYKDAHGRTFELLHAKAPKTTFLEKPRITAQYVLVEGPELPIIDLKLELSKIAAFGRLPTRKIVARLDLMQSTARVSKSKAMGCLIFNDLTSADFEEIAESAHEGCGYVPKAYLTRFLGNHAVGKRTFAIQVRIFAPQLGIFKGVLCEKPGIDKIQLPESMKKVGPSELEVDDTATLLVNGNGVFPSYNNLQLSKVFACQAPPKSFRPKPVSDMILSLWEALHVDGSVISEYTRNVRMASHFSSIRHANLIGLADPLGCIPAGHVFITGCGPEIHDKIFVTRYPCAEANDGKLLPLLRSKPASLPQKDWDWVNSLPFGGIMFGDPLPGQPPLPTTIADGDLDGDLYFVCWDEKILSSILAPDCEASRQQPSKLTSEPIDIQRDNWLLDAQLLMGNIIATKDRQKLISALYNNWRKCGFAQGWSSENALHFGRAYKRSLELEKHGGTVWLPVSLWNNVPTKWHHFLSDDV